LSVTGPSEQAQWVIYGRRSTTTTTTKLFSPKKVEVD
jgi:hypothetical protein